MNTIFERPTLNRTTDKENIALVDRWIADTVDKLNNGNSTGNSGSSEEVPTKLSELEDDSMHRTVTDAEKSFWNTKPSGNNTYLITDTTATAIDDEDHVPFLTTSGKRKITLTNIKAKLKTYFDTLYASISHTHTKSQITDFAHTHTKSDVTDLGTAASKDVPTSGNASSSQVVMGNDTRLTDSRTPTSHTHTKSDITDFPTLATVATTGSYNDLSNKPSIPAAQIQSDWNQTTTTAKDFIKNKPTIPSAQVNSDWTSSSGVSEILHKPTLGTAAALDVATSGDASTIQVVKGDDTRLTDARTPTSHTHTTSQITDFPTITDTKNTAGSTDTSDKIYLVGAKSQAANPQTYSDNEVFAQNGVLSSKKLSSKCITALTGTGTAGQDKGSGSTNRYVPSLWTFNSSITVANGEVYFIKIPVAGGTYGVWLSLNNGTNYYPVAVSNAKARFTTHYAKDTVIGVTYESAGVCNCYARTGADTLADVTGCFRVFDSYDSNTTYSAMSSSELTTGTATTSRVVRADYLKTGVNSLIDTKINALDVTGASSISAGKTISAWSETNGKVSVTTQDISITKSQVSDFPTLATVATSGSYTDLINKPTDLISYTVLRSNVTASANSFVRVPASGTIRDLPIGVIIPVCDDKPNGGGPHRYKSVIRDTYTEEDEETGIVHTFTDFSILIGEAITNKQIGVVVIGIP